MSATTGPSLGERRRRRCSTIRASIGRAPRRHLEAFADIQQADAFAGYLQALRTQPRARPYHPGGVLGHARRKFSVLADIDAAAQRNTQGKTSLVLSPIAPEAVRRVDALFEIERAVNGLDAKRRKAVRAEQSAPLVAGLHGRMGGESAKLSRHNDLAKAMDSLDAWVAAQSLPLTKSRFFRGGAGDGNRKRETRRTR